jgi:hypothetical protein
MSQEKRYGLPEEIFRFVDGEQDIVNEQEMVTPVEKIMFDKGVYVYLKGADYPQMGIAVPETMYAVNLVKRIIIEPIKFLNKWYFYPSILFLSTETVLRTFNDITWRYMKPFVLKKEFMSPQVKEFEWLLYSFLKKIKIDDTVAEQFSTTIAHAIEYDNAYRLRFVDMWSIASRDELIKNPRKELLLIAKTVVKRGQGTTERKFLYIARLLGIMLLVPKYRSAFSSAFKEIDLNKLKSDKLDQYWMCLRKENYNYMGLSDEQREQLLNKLGQKKPEMVKRK